MKPLPLPLPLPLPHLLQHPGGLFTSSKFEFNPQGGSFTTSGALLSHLRGSIGLDFILRWGNGVLQKYNDVPLKKTSFAPNGGNANIALEARQCMLKVEHTLSLPHHRKYSSLPPRIQFLPEDGSCQNTEGFVSRKKDSISGWRTT